MNAPSPFRKALQDAVLERHCANHPMTEKWAKGTLSRNCLKGIAVEHFWLHSEVDIEHGNRGFEALEKYCTTREMQDRAIDIACRSARMRWFYFDGIYLHYEQGYDFL